MAALPDYRLLKETEERKKNCISLWIQHIQHIFGRNFVPQPIG